MKIFGPKSLSTYLFYGIRTTALLMALFVLYLVFSFVLDNYEVSNGRFTIPFPLFSYFDIKGIYETSIIKSILLGSLYLAVFLYSLSMIFKSFKSKVLFSTNAIHNLNFFAALNLIVFPILYFVLRIVILKISLLGGIHNLILSIVLGIFILLVSAIFTRGLKVQEENDLTI